MDFGICRYVKIRNDDYGTYIFNKGERFANYCFKPLNKICEHSNKTASTIVKLLLVIPGILAGIIAFVGLLVGTISERFNNNFDLREQVKAIDQKIYRIEKKSISKKDFLLLTHEFELKNLDNFGWHLAKIKFIEPSDEEQDKIFGETISAQVFKGIASPVVQVEDVKLQEFLKIRSNIAAKLVKNNMDLSDEMNALMQLYLSKMEEYTDHRKEFNCTLESYASNIRKEFMTIVDNITDVLKANPISDVGKKLMVKRLNESKTKILARMKPKTMPKP